MRNKSRKRIWSGVLVMSFTIVGVLVAFAVLVGNPTLTDAHSGGAQGSHCTGESDAFSNAHDALTPADHPKCADDTDTGNGNGNNQAPVLTGTPLADVSLRIPSQSDSIDVSVAFDDPDADDVLTYSAESNNTGVATVSIDGSMMVLSTGAVRGAATITVTATDNDGATVSITFMVRVAEGYTLTAVPVLDPDNTSTYVVEDLGEYTAKFSVKVGGSNDDVTVTITATEPDDGGITITDSDGLIGAGFNQDNDLEGSLTIKSEDDDDARSFEIEGVCQTVGAMVKIVVEDDDLEEVAKGYILCKEPPEPVAGPDRTDVSDAFTVVSYGDWDSVGFTDGIVDEDDPAGVEHIVNDHHRATGMLHRDDPVVAGYQLGISDRENLGSLPDGSPRRAKTDANLTREEKNADVEEGQRTVEVLVGAPNVQLTVTSMEAGPAYIRFLDKDMQPFGTDVDEDPRWLGADVVGLDSQGHLALNNAGVELSAAMALAYDQYTIVTPGIIPGQRPANSYLVGAAGAYNQGSFRFMNPCPTDDHHFYVQVYEAGGKYLRTTEKIDCIPSLRPGPTGLEFEINSDDAGDAVLTFERGRAAGSHTALLIDARNRNIVSEVTRRVGSERVQQIMFDNLNSGWTYHIVVIAHGANEQHTADALKDFQVRWLGEPDVPLSTAPSATATRSHDLCNIEQDNKDDITALLSDCDAAPADLTAPTGVRATASGSDVTVRWTDGANAVQHVVLLLDSEFALAMPAATQQTDGTTTFQNVAAGSYTAVVVAIESSSSYLYSHVTVSVGQ